MRNHLFEVCLCFVIIFYLPARVANSFEALNNVQPQVDHPLFLNRGWSICGPTENFPVSDVRQNLQFWGSMQLLQGRPHKIAWENNKTNLNNNGPYPKNKGAACYWSSSKIKGSWELSTILGWGGGGGYFLGLDSLLRKNTFFSVKCIVGKFKFAVLHQFFGVCQFPVSSV